MAKTRAATSDAPRTGGLSPEETILAYAAVFVLLAAIGFTLGAIFVG